MSAGTPQQHSARTAAAPETSTEHVAAVQKRTLIILIITQVVGTIGVGVGPSIGVLLASDVTDNEMWAGLARTSSTLGAALLGIPLGTLAAKHGRRIALASGWWLAGLGAGVLVFAAQWNLIVPLFVGLLMLGAGGAVSLQSRFAATDLAEPKRKARSLALVVWVGTLGSVIGPNLGVPGEWLGAATGLVPFSAAFLIAGTALISAGTLVFILLRPDPLKLLLKLNEDSSAPMPTGFKARFAMMISEIRVNKPARIAFIAILVSQSVMAAIMTMTPVHITHEGGSVAVVGITISMHVAGMYALSPLVGWLTDKLGHRPSMWIGVFIFFISLLIGVFFADSLAWIMADLFLLGVGWCFVNVAGSALFSTVVAPTVRATSQGGVDASSNLAGAFASFIAGPLLVATSFSMLSIVAMLVMVPLILVILRPIPYAGTVNAQPGPLSDEHDPRAATQAADEVEAELQRVITGEIETITQK